MNKNALAKFLKKIKRTEKQIDFLSDEELQSLPVGTTFIFDAEIYVNLFFIAFKLKGTNKHVFFEQSEWQQLDTNKLSWMLWRFLLVSFNGINFDLPLIFYALQGATCQQLKSATSNIIDNQLRAFAFEREYKIKVPTLNHIDLIEVAPLSGSLKLYGARLHSKRLQDLPYPPDWVMDAHSAEETRQYCTVDLDVTELLLDQMEKEIQLRVDMSNEYGIELRSKSDAQIAEAVICSELKKITGTYPKKPNVDSITGVQYSMPDFIKFSNPLLQKTAEDISNTIFPLNGLGSPMWPEGLGTFEKDSAASAGKWEINLKIGETTYKVGMGGLHSKEKDVSHIATDSILLEDHDVASFYPRIILNQELFPAHLGRAFLEVYNLLVTRRLDAKKRVSELKKEKFKLQELLKNET